MCRMPGRSWPAPLGAVTIRRTSGAPSRPGVETSRTSISGGGGGGGGIISAIMARAWTRLSRSSLIGGSCSISGAISASSRCFDGMAFLAGPKTIRRRKGSQRKWGLALWSAARLGPVLAHVDEKQRPPVRVLQHEGAALVVTRWFAVEAEAFAADKLGDFVDVALPEVQL